MTTILNLSNFDKSWTWLSEEFQDEFTWSHITTSSNLTSKNSPIQAHVIGYLTAMSAVSSLRKSNRAIIVSHGPKITCYGATAAQVLNPQLPHLACSFNFTDLPTGITKKAMIAAFRQVSKFLTYSTVERHLYAEYFEIPIGKIDMLHWAVHPPYIDPNSIPIEAGPYICALGSQARDYATLFAAIEKLPNTKLVVVASRESIGNLRIPSNVRLYLEIPREKALNILQHSQFMIVPLRDSRVPCGHVTIVSGMFYNKAILIANSIGVHDYIKDGESGLFYTAGDAIDLRLKITMLLEQPEVALHIAKKGNQFAQANCNYKHVVNYFAKFVQTFE